MRSVAEMMDWEGYRTVFWRGKRTMYVAAPKMAWPMLYVRLLALPCKDVKPEAIRGRRRESSWHQYAF